MSRETIFPDLPPDILARVEALREGREAVSWPPIYRSSWASTDLTLRELDVLALIAEGLTDKEIGVRLGIGKQTVMTHVKRILRKTGTVSRAHAVAQGFRQGDLT